eukprot:gene5544-7663_t
MDKDDQGDVSFSTLIINASIVAQQFTVCVTFLTTYKYISIDNKFLVYIEFIDFLLLLVGYAIHRVLSVENKLTLVETLQSLTLFGICLRIAAPILRTLTSTYSSDTIHALAIFFTTLHLVFYDYAHIHSDESSYFGSTSLNAAMVVAIILASRLQNVEQVVALILFAVLSFSLFPSTSRLIKKRSINLHFYFALFQWIVASILLWFLDKTLFAVYEMFMLFLWLVAPYWFRAMLVNKKSYRGPWDVAEVE